MKYGDLSSIVQLGVGLHVGTAVLQLFGELGVAPLKRRLTRIRSLFRVPEAERPPKSLEEELDQLESRYELFNIDFFNQYRWCVALNSIIAIVLAVFLIIIAIKADDVIQDGYEWFAVTSIALSFFPAPIILGVLWFDARRRVRTLKATAHSIETRALEGPSSCIPKAPTTPD
jgi:hypothetical protein